MKIENGSRYQETEIVSYVQVIYKAEIDRYLQRGKRKVCDGTHGMEGWWWWWWWVVVGRGARGVWGDCSSQKIKKKKKKKGGEGKKEMAEKAKGEGCQRECE